MSQERIETWSASGVSRKWFFTKLGTLEIELGSTIIMNTMLKTVAVSSCSVLLSAWAGQASIATWTFENSPPADLNNSVSISGILADSGTGTASGVHASAATDWTTPVGNGSANSLSANTWAVGDYFQFSSSTIGFENITISWAQVSSATGPGTFKLAYQVNGGGFTDFLNYTVLPNQLAAPGLGVWNSTTAIPGYNFLADFSAVNALDNAASVDFRLIMRTTVDALPPGAVVGGGTDRVDNFSISGTELAVVPEASTWYAGIGLSLGMLFSFIRKMRK